MHASISPSMSSSAEIDPFCSSLYRHCIVHTTMMSPLCHRNTTCTCTLSLCLVSGFPGSGITSVTSYIRICTHRVCDIDDPVPYHIHHALYSTYPPFTRHFFSTHRGRSYDDVLFSPAGSLLASQLHHLHGHHSIKTTHVKSERQKIDADKLRSRSGMERLEWNIGLTWHWEWVPTLWESRVGDKICLPLRK